MTRASDIRITGQNRTLVISNSGSIIDKPVLVRESGLRIRITIQKIQKNIIR
jgi:hypothetical protein